MDIAKILLQIRPGEKWSLRGNDYDGLEWLDTTPKPTFEELEAGQAEIDALAYRDLRRAEYPPIGDQLDALWKGGDAAAAMLAEILAVKAKYPKPGGQN